MENLTLAVLDWIAREPVRFRAFVVAVIGSLVTLGASFGFDLSAEQTSAIVGVIVAIAVGVAEASRRKVTPVD